MSELIKKTWKRLLETEVPMKLPSEYVASFQTLQYEITHINQRLRQIEAWMNDFANPKIKEHIDQIKSIFSEITNNILPMVKKAQAWAENALTRAQEAFDRAEAFINVLRKSSSQLVIDGQDIINQASSLARVYIEESGRIINAYINYGKKVGAEIKNVYIKAKYVADEMLEAKKQIGIPLGKAKSDAKKALYCWDKLRKGGWSHKYIFCCLDEGIDAIKYMTFKGYGGQDSVLEELIEAFKEVGAAMIGLANAYASYSSVVYNETINLGKTIRISFERIGEATTSFADSIKNLAVNLSNNLKI